MPRRIVRLGGREIALGMTAGDPSLTPRSASSACRFASSMLFFLSTLATKAPSTGSDTSALRSPRRLMALQPVVSLIVPPYACAGAGGASGCPARRASSASSPNTRAVGKAHSTHSATSSIMTLLTMR